MHNIGFYGEIDQQKIALLFQSLRREHMVGQRVFIDSPGGTFEFFSEMGPSLRRLGFTAIGKHVYSAAIFLFLLGHKRYAVPDAKFLFHEVRTIVDDGGHITVSDVGDFVDYYNTQKMHGASREALEEWYHSLHGAQEWAIHFITERSPIGRARLRNLIAADAILTAKEAKRYGLIHGIVSYDQILQSQ